MKLTTLIGVGLAIITSGASAQDRPAKRAQQGRGQLFISPMGEPFRSTQKPGAAQALWFAEADADHDGRLTASEFQRDALRFFAMLDRRQDGEIDPEDIGWYENVLVPEIRVRQGRGSSPRASGAQKSGDRGDRGSGGKQAIPLASERLGAGRYGLFDLPEPVIAADANFNRGVDKDEFVKAAALRFAALDRNHDGAITRRELPRAGAETWRNGSDATPAVPGAR